MRGFSYGATIVVVFTLIGASRSWAQVDPIPTGPLPSPALPGIVAPPPAPSVTPIPDHAVTSPARPGPYLPPPPAPLPPGAVQPVEPVVTPYRSPS